MMKSIFRTKEEESKTGIYVIKNSVLIELDETPGNGSINSIIESMGFSLNQIHTVHMFDSKDIEVLGFKIFSKEVLFAVLKETKKLSLKNISKEKKQIDWQFEYSSLNIEDILNDGVDLQNLTLDFLSSVLNLTQEDNNLYKVEEFDLYLQFKDNILQSFTSSEWDNSSSKWLKDINESMYLGLVDEAKMHHENDLEAMEEVNKQSDSLLKIPEAVNNEFIPLHKKPNGNINFYNLYITHYSQDCVLDDFILMNRGRYNKLDKSKYEIGNFIYEFNDSNELANIFRK